MKLSRIILALAAGAIACPNAQLPNHEVNLNALFGRAVDPSTMDPVRLSVLEVLKTAMPTGSNMALPSGTVEPDWYKKLPQDIKNILPSLYPLTTTKVAAAAVTPTSAVASASVPASAPVSAFVSSSVPPSTSSKATSSMFSSSKTRKAYNASSTASGNFSMATSRPANANTTLPTTGVSLSAPPLPTRTFSTGTKTAIRLEMLTALMWLGLGAGFLIFA